MPQDLKNLTPEQLDQVITTISGKAGVATATGGLISIGGITLSSTILGLIGATVAIAGMLVNWYYLHKKHKLDAEYKLKKYILEEREYLLKEKEYLKHFPESTFGSMECKVVTKE